jgi:hypothetical protein
MGVVSFVFRLPFSLLGYLLSITKNSVLIAAAIIYLGTPFIVCDFAALIESRGSVDHINMRNHLLQVKYRQSFNGDYVPIHARFYESLKRLTMVTPEQR